MFKFSYFTLTSFENNLLIAIQSEITKLTHRNLIQFPHFRENFQIALRDI